MVYIFWLQSIPLHLYFNLVVKGEIIKLLEYLRIYISKVNISSWPSGIWRCLKQSTNRINCEGILINIHLEFRNCNPTEALTYFNLQRLTSINRFYLTCRPKLDIPWYILSSTANIPGLCLIWIPFNEQTFSFFLIYFPGQIMAHRMMRTQRLIFEELMKGKKS